MPIGTACGLEQSRGLVAAAVLGVTIAAWQGQAAWGQTWQAAGPSPTTGGQVEGMAGQNSPVAGAINAVLASPTDANVLYIGAANGGIWKTTNGGTTWTPLTDFQQSLSIGDLAFDPTDATGNTLVAGIGRFSSFAASPGGARTGLLYTTNGGASWTTLDGGLAGKNITEVAARGNTIVTAVNTADSFVGSNVGIFRSTDGGTSFTHISGSSGTDAPNGLPGGRAFDLAADPTSNSTFYVGIRDAGTNNGIYKSTDTGATWTRVSNAAMNALNDDAPGPYDYTTTNVANIEISVGKSGQVYVGIIGGYGQLTGLFRSGDGGGTWTQLDTPTTNENGHAVGLQPDREDNIDIAGGQGAIHFSIQADPTNANVVYVGGDRQPSQVNILGNGTGVFPNSIGAQDYSGRLFRVDASKTAGTQATPLTNNYTSNGSSPHADSRAQTFDANGNLIEVDDGGIFKRTSPSTETGGWTSLNGNLQIAEVHSIAYDRVAKTIFAGTQDTGSIEQSAAGSTTWRTGIVGDGGKVAVFVDPHVATPTQSVRYTSYTNLQDFTRTVFDASNNAISTTSPTMKISSGTGSGSKVTTYFGEHLQFYNPISVNHRNGNLYVGSRYVFESSDGGDSFANIGYLGGYDASCFDAGGMYNGIENADVMYVGANVSGPSYSSYTIFSRTAPGALTQDTAYTYGAVQDLVMDTADWHVLFVADPDQIFESTNAAQSFVDITGNLAGQNFHVLAFAQLSTLSILLAGSDNGVFYATSDDWTKWLELGATSLPNAPVYDLQYDAVDDILVAGTLGRGAWTMSSFSATFVPEPTDLALLLLGGTVLARRRRPSQV